MSSNDTYNMCTHVCMRVCVCVSVCMYECMYVLVHILKLEQAIVQENDHAHKQHPITNVKPHVHTPQPFVATHISWHSCVAKRDKVELIHHIYVYIYIEYEPHPPCVYRSCCIKCSMTDEK